MSANVLSELPAGHQTPPTVWVFRPVDLGTCKMAAGIRNLNCSVPERPQSWLRTPPYTASSRGGSASACALNPMVTTMRAGGCAGGASQG
eukprot:13443633-Alexandrium_andersonii.AAC.1